MLLYCSRSLAGLCNLGDAGGTAVAAAGVAVIVVTVDGVGGAAMVDVGVDM